MRRYVLSPRAQADIEEEIWTFTVDRWGFRQAEDYIDRLRIGIETLASDPSRGRRCDDIRTGYFKYPIASHVLFYRTMNAEIDVVRILHRRLGFRTPSLIALQTHRR